MKDGFWRAYSFLITILLIQHWYGYSFNKQNRMNVYEKNKMEYQYKYKAGLISKNDYDDLMMDNDELFKK